MPTYQEQPKRLSKEEVRFLCIDRKWPIDEGAHFLHRNKLAKLSTFGIEDEAMDLYAQQEAIAFFQWNAEKILEYVEWLKNGRQMEDDSEKEYAKQCEITSFELSTIKKRYQLFKSQIT